MTIESKKPEPWKLVSPFSGSERGPYPTRAEALKAVGDWRMAGITYQASHPIADEAMKLDAWAAYEKTGMTPSQLAEALSKQTA